MATTWGDLFSSGLSEDIPIMVLVTLLYAGAPGLGGSTGKL